VMARFPFPCPPLLLIALCCRDGGGGAGRAAPSAAGGSWSEGGRSGAQQVGAEGEVEPDASAACAGGHG